VNFYNIIEFVHKEHKPHVQILQLVIFLHFPEIHSQNDNVHNEIISLSYVFDLLLFYIEIFFHINEILYSFRWCQK